MKTNNILIIGVFALAFYWLYLRNKANTHTATAEAVTAKAVENPAAALPPPATAFKNKPVAPKPRPYVKPTLLNQPAVENPLASFTIVKVKTPFIYEN